MDTVLRLILFIYVSKVCGTEQECQPVMPNPAVNVTVIEGGTATLLCAVENLCDHKVVWVDMWSTLLTLNDRRIIDDTRISIERPSVVDWNLQIRNTSHTDQMEYTCAVNTNPIITTKVMLTVKPVLC